MLTEERHSRIVALVEEKESISVPELATLLNTSESTVRRDLLALDRLGRLRKVHGGAVKAETGMLLTEPNVSDKKKLFFAEKDAVAKYAAGLIKNGDFVFIDAGTTTEKMLTYITEKNVTFVTNAFNHARQLARRGYKVLLAGGELKDTTEAIVGVSCVEMLKNYNFTKCFLGTNGISPEGGFTTHDIDEAAVKRTAAERGYITYVLADHSKFNKTAAVSFAGISKACIITDRVPDEKYRSLTVLKEVCK